MLTIRPGLLLDGATGTNMQRAGMPQGACTEQWILEHPQPLMELQRAYQEAGSDLVYAPTFGANRAALERHGLGEKVREYNLALSALSRRAVGNSCAVAGGMSPTSLFLEPAGDATFQDLYEIYREQAEALAEGGVDLIVIETMMNLAEARIALLAAKEGAGLPVLVTVTVDQTGRTMSGNSALSCLTVLQGAGADAFGFNCSTGPEEMLEIVRSVAPYAAIPLVAKPNAGMPKVVDGETVFDFAPQLMADAAERLVAAGAEILGGCCGTTPEHIRLLRTALDRALERPREVEKQPDELLAASEREAFFVDPLADLSPAVSCTEDLAEDILDLEDEYDVIKLEFGSEEDVEIFRQNAYMISSPLCLSAHSCALLEQAARAYCGRALFDGRDEEEFCLDGQELNRILRKYGMLRL